MNNIKLTYLYRDCGNYKRYGSIVFANPNNIPVSVFKETVIDSLMDGEYFDANKCGLPSLFFERTNEDDHQWHELGNIEPTDEAPNTNLQIEIFVKNITAL